MRCISGFLVVTLCFCAFSPPPAANPPSEDLAAELKTVSGKWCFSAYRVDGFEFPKDLLKKVKVAISDQTLQIKPGPVHQIDTETGKTTYHLGDDFDAKIKLNPAARPKVMDLVISYEGRVDTLEGIYRLDGDKLTICFSLGKERPTDFKAEKGSQARLLILERSQP